MLSVSSHLARLIPTTLLALTAFAGDFISFQAPNAHFTYAYQINSQNQIVGLYVTDGNPRLYSGYIRQADGTIDSILPNPIFSTALAINNSGVVTGTWADETTEHG